MTDNISTLGFNGEFLDSTLDNYHLGNGYRAYNPNIMAFTAPDDMSPFGSGGINPYVYVSGDPINNTDPSGHFAGFLGAIIGIINMVSPLQVPTSLSVAGVEEAVMGTVVNVGVDLATDGLGAAATPVLRTVEGVARSTADDVIENVAQHAIISDIPTSHDTRYMDKLLNWVYEKPENQRDYYSWLHDTTHQSDAPGPARHITLKPYRTRQEIRNIVNTSMTEVQASGSDLQYFKLIKNDGTEHEAFVFPYKARENIASSGDLKTSSELIVNNSDLQRAGNLRTIRNPWKGSGGYKDRYDSGKDLFIKPPKESNAQQKIQVGKLIVFSRPYPKG